MNSERFSEAVLAWGAVHGRRGMAWHPLAGAMANPYFVWLSEIMLQQTQLTTVQAYFDRFIQRFPRVEDLAGAPLDDVLAQWSGLGYYQRARNLWASARLICKSGEAVFPQTLADWTALPGVGRSTAAAIVSVVYGQREAILDGNVKRLLARCTAAPEPWASAALERALWPKAIERLPPPGFEGAMPLYTQSIMDLGATICLPRQPLCDRCPLTEICVAYRMDAVDRYPVPRLQKNRPEEYRRWLLISDGPLWCLVQRPGSGIWAGLWTPPEWPMALEWPQESTGGGQLVHDFTHRRWIIEWRAAKASDIGKRYGQPPNGHWFSQAELLGLALPAPVRKLMGSIFR